MNICGKTCSIGYGQSGLLPTVHHPGHVVVAKIPDGQGITGLALKLRKLCESRLGECPGFLRVAKLPEDHRAYQITPEPHTQGRGLCVLESLLVFRRADSDRWQKRIGTSPVGAD